MGTPRTGAKYVVGSALEGFQQFAKVVPRPPIVTSGRLFDRMMACPSRRGTSMRELLRSIVRVRCAQPQLGRTENIETVESSESGGLRRTPGIT
ncbi:hypothetical protein BD309DRAFT_970436 [Dichomitus squalens]|nr:hypothetical protein BD309DRAFT_970436 [Dichomitus squalens]